MTRINVEANPRCRMYARVDDPDNTGKTPLFAAAMRGQLDVVQKLLALGANPNIQVENGRTPLSMAAFNGHYEIVEVLLAVGADPNIKDKDGSTPLLLSIMGNKTDMRNLLQEKTVNTDSECIKTLLPHAVIEGNDELVWKLLSLGVDPNFTDNNGKTPLSHAIEQGQDTIITLLQGYSISNSEDKQTIVPPTPTDSEGSVMQTSG